MVRVQPGELEGCSEPDSRKNAESGNLAGALVYRRDDARPSNRCRGGDRDRRRCRARDRRCCERPADPGQRRPVHERDEPARDRGRARHVRVRLDGRRGLPGRPVLRRRRLRHRLRALHRRRRDLGRLELPARPDVQRGPVRRPGQPVRARQRPERRLRRQARHVDDLLDPAAADDLVVPTVFVSRSTDGGATFGNPVADPAAGARRSTSTRTGPSATTTPASPFYGNCYTEFDNFGEGDLEYMSTSSDGGLTWSTPVSPAGNPKGLGGQPVVQPDGTVIVPFESLKGTIGAFRSTDGGATWSKEVHGLEDQLPPELRRPADEPAAERRDRRRRQRLRGLGGLPLRAEVHGQRHRLQQLGRRRELERRQRGSRSTPSAAASTTSSPAWPSIRPPRDRARTWR